RLPWPIFVTTAQVTRSAGAAGCVRPSRGSERCSSVGDEDAEQDERAADEMVGGDLLAEKGMGETGGEQRHQIGEQAGSVGADRRDAAVPTEEGDDGWEKADIEVAQRGVAGLG